MAVALPHVIFGVLQKNAPALQKTVCHSTDWGPPLAKIGEMGENVATDTCERETKGGHVTPSPRAGRAIPSFNSILVKIGSFSKLLVESGQALAATCSPRPKE